MRKLFDFLLREGVLIVSLLIVAMIAFGLGLIVGINDLKLPCWGLVWK